MTRRRLSRRALLAALGSTAAATAGCTAPSRSQRTTERPSSDSEGTDDPEISLSGDDAWTTYGYDPGHSGHNPNAAGPDADPTQVWGSYVEGIYTLREPAVADGRVYVGSEQSMWAFDATNGDQAWKTDLGSMPHQYPPTYADDTLYVVSKESGGVNNTAPGYVRALEPRTAGYGGPRGSRSRRRWPTTARRSTSPRRSPGPVTCVRSTPRPATPAGDSTSPTPRGATSRGRPRTPTARCSSPPRTSRTTARRPARCTPLDPEDGSVNWSRDADSALPVAPVVANDRVHLAARGGTVRAFSLDGEAAWTADTGARVYTRPTYADGRLFVLTTSDIVAYDDAGDELWRAGSERTQMTGMTVAEETLYVGGEPLFALDVTDGSVTFDLEVGVFHGSFGAPVVVDDVLYAGICIKGGRRRAVRQLRPGVRVAGAAPARVLVRHDGASGSASRSDKPRELLVRRMGRMVDGEWRTEEEQIDHDDEGEFERDTTSFRDWVGEDYPAESGRYHLYVSYACPWAHRTLLVRALKGLEDAISVSVVDPVRYDQGWEFDADVPGATPDHLFDSEYLREVYARADENYTGRVTVPVLYDTGADTIVNNESEEIMRMFDGAFDELATRDVDLYPEGYQDEIDSRIEDIYTPSTTASTARASRAASAPTRRPSRSCSRRSTSTTTCSPTSATSPATASRSRTWRCSPRCTVSTRSTTRTSSATTSRSRTTTTSGRTSANSASWAPPNGVRGRRTNERGAKRLASRRASRTLSTWTT